MTQMEAPRIDSGRIAEVAHGLDRAEVERREKVFSVSDLSVAYHGNVALDGVDLDVHKNTVTAFIGPSGCGKSTFIRCFNRMNDLIPGAKVSGNGAVPRGGPLRTRRRRGRDPPPHRHGLPEAEPVPEVDLRQHRVRARASSA